MEFQLQDENLSSQARIVFYCFAPVRKYVLEAHRQASSVVATRSLREPRNSLPRSCQAKGRKSPIQAKSTYFLRGKSLDGREHGDLERQAQNSEESR